MEYELKILKSDGKRITRKWDGKDGLDACKRYADNHPDETVLAWRDDQYPLAIGIDMRQVIE